jgi:hypothetical protein
MNTTIKFLLVIVLSHCTISSFSKNNDKVIASRYMELNGRWKFVRDSVPNAQESDFDDSGWTTVDLPHDFSPGPTSRSTPRSACTAP